MTGDSGIDHVIYMFADIYHEPKETLQREAGKIASNSRQTS